MSTILWKCLHRLRVRHGLRNISTSGLNDFSGGDEVPRRVKLAKRLFWALAFGGTFVAAVVVRRKRRQDAQAFMEHYQQLPDDINFKDGGRSFRYKGFVFPSAFGRNIFHELENFQARPDDVYVVSFPKTGTTWVQEIVYLVASDLNFSKAANNTLETRFPFLEFIYPGINSINKMPSPRFIKTHLPLSLLPQTIEENKCKVIYVTRNPKDVAVSFFHFVRMLTVTDYQGTFNELVAKLVKDELPYSPFWQHVLPFWERREDENILFIKYEDLHKDLSGVVNQIGRFLGRTLADHEVDRVVSHCNFVSMRANPMVNYDHWSELGLRKKESENFIRKGQVGDWQNYFTPRLNDLMNEWITKNSEGTDLQFDYKLKTSPSVK